MSRTKSDVTIIGAGAVGIGLARELSKYELDVIVVDGRNDVGGDASKSNSAIIHTGFDAPPDTPESEMVVHSNPMFDRLCRDLDIPFTRCGAILVATTEEEEAELPGIMQKAVKNRVFDVEYLRRAEILDLEPEVTPEVRAGLLIPRESIIEPFILVVAQAENAAANGMEFRPLSEVVGLRRTTGGYEVTCESGIIESRFVVNAAGLGAAQISGYLGIDDFTVHPRRGQFYVIDRAAPLHVDHIILPVPTKITKGKLLTPTVHGNWLAGPTAEDIEERDGSITRQGLEEITAGVRKLVPSFDPSYAVTEYSGLRPVRTPGGYHLRTFGELPGYLELSGIRSTGVSSSLAVAQRGLGILREMGLQTTKKSNFVGTRKGITRFADLDFEQRERLVAADPRYSTVVCRCETVTEAEIYEAITRKPGARDLDGIKRRTRAGLGRCQSGFCGSRIPMILSEALGEPLEGITKMGPGSELFGTRKTQQEETP